VNPLVLAALVVLTWWVLPVAWHDAPWCRRRPATALVAWTADVILGGLSVVLLCLRLVVGASSTAPTVAMVGRSVTLALRGEPLQNFGFAAIVGVTLALDFVAVVAGTYLHAALRARHHRRRQLAALQLVAPGTGIAVVPHGEPDAYFVPGRPGRVVITESLRARLSPDELRAILAHEEAHRTGHHGAFLVLASAIRRWEKLLPVASLVAEGIEQSLEFSADDRVRRFGGQRYLQSALRQVVAWRESPPGVLAASGSDITLRILRTTATPLDRQDRQRAVVVGLVAFLAFTVMAHL
jgi:Peptidase family M48